MKLYRVMKVDVDGKPLVGIRFGMLGVRPKVPTSTNRSDVSAAKDNDSVYPGEGLSTSTDPESLPTRRGERVFEIESDQLSTELKTNHDRPGHCLIEPANRVTLVEFQQALAETRDSWHPV